MKMGDNGTRPAMNVQFASDVLTRSVASIDANGNRNMSVYDAASRAVASVNPLGKRWTTVYDAASQSVASIDAKGNRSTTVYDAASKFALLSTRWSSAVRRCMTKPARPSQVSMR